MCLQQSLLLFCCTFDDNLLSLSFHFPNVSTLSVFLFFLPVPLSVVERCYDFTGKARKDITE